MSLYSLQGLKPKIGENNFIAPSADVIGRVFTGKNVSVWYQVVLRGDIEEIHIGDNTNIQDQSVVHVTEGYPAMIGKNVSIGHNVTIHACKIGDGSLIGIGAVILDGAEIGENSVVAAGAVIPPNKKFPANSFIMGSPAEVKRQTTAEEIEKYSIIYKGYRQGIGLYNAEVREIEQSN